MLSLSRMGIKKPTSPNANGVFLDQSTLGLQLKSWIGNPKWVASDVWFSDTFSKLTLCSLIAGFIDCLLHRKQYYCHIPHAQQIYGMNGYSQTCQNLQGYKMLVSLSATTPADDWTWLQRWSVCSLRLTSSFVFQWEPSLFYSCQHEHVVANWTLIAQRKKACLLDLLRNDHVGIWTARERQSRNEIKTDISRSPNPW